ncbi:hypothetical protein HAX54_000959 [Datura stramonium]|uniref:Ferric reductase NAD binding domain-containing protein n=1 Tax=Datura stramonium TaxID=4076 RepID=A0ABS8T1R6_DATST|nr:hypothetical protein [Datura stramonium]
MQMWQWHKVGISTVAGEMSLLAGIAMWLTSFPRIRRKAKVQSNEFSFHKCALYIKAAVASIYSDFQKPDMLVMVSGGSGITPFISIIRELIYIAGLTSCKIPKVVLVASFKKSADLTMLYILLPLSGTTCDTSWLQLQIEAHVTREEPLKDKLPRTLWLKPNASERQTSVCSFRPEQLALAWSYNHILFHHVSSAHWHSKPTLYIPC